MGFYSFTLSDLKNSLGIQLGAFTNRFLFEIPVETTLQKTIGILCKSVSFPSATIGQVHTFYKGRKFIMRGETEFNNTLTVTFYDDSELNLRRFFDTWRLQIDNTNPQNTNIFGVLGDSIENIKNTIENGSSLFKNFNLGSFFLNLTDETPHYQLPLNIWQMDKNQNKVYGYTITNAFPVEITGTDFDSSNSDLNILSVTFTFSEYEIISEKNIKDELKNKLLGFSLI